MSKVNTVSYVNPSLGNLQIKNPSQMLINRADIILNQEKNINTDSFENNNQIVETHDDNKQKTSKARIRKILIGLGIGLVAAVVTGFAVKKLSGVMSTREIMKKSTNLGNEIAQKAAETGQVTVDDIQQVINSQLGKKAKNINLIQDKQGFLKAMREAQGVPEEMGEIIWNNSLSASLPNMKGATILNIRANEIAVDKIANVAAHEYEHALNQTFSVKQKIAKLYLKTPMGKRQLAKIMPYAEEMNMASLCMQGKSIIVGKLGGDAAGGLTCYKPTMEGLLQQTEVSDIKTIRGKFQDFLTGRILGSRCDYRADIIKLQGLKNSLTDEARAYAVGGRAEQTYLGLLGANPEGLATKSEFNSMLNREALKVVKKELRHTYLSRIKEFFKIRPRSVKSNIIEIKDIEQEINNIKPKETISRIASEIKPFPKPVNLN